jgi:FecR protein
MDEQKQHNEARDIREENINLDVEPNGQQTPGHSTLPEDEKLIPAEAESLHQKTKRHVAANMRTFVMIGIVLVLMLAVVGAALAFSVFKDDEKQTQTTQVPKVALMGAELTVADGYVQTGPDNKLWEDAKVGDQISEGMYVRTQPSARAVIALDDGSAIRINGNSVVKVNSLDVASVVITNVSGEVYTRLVKSDRQFSVKVADEEYVALGTAYKTVNTADIKGVEVYESIVKLTKTNIEVPEGKLYYKTSNNAELSQKITDITVDKIKQDTFVAWNYEQDKNNTEFKDKLGYLTKIDEPVAPPTPPVTTKTTTATASIKLTGTAYETGVKLSWKLSNMTAGKGFKVVKSLSANPTYGKDDAVFVGATTSSYAWKIKDGKTYHFRVCAYTGEGCSTYSNDITVTAPMVTVADPQPSGTLSLSQTSGADFSWVLDGSSPYGYKLVWSTSTAPVYPGNDYAFYSDEATKSGTITASGGTYYVRVCMYNKGSCVNYSNEVVVTLP